MVRQTPGMVARFRGALGRPEVSLGSMALFSVERQTPGRIAGFDGSWDTPDF